MALLSPWNKAQAVNSTDASFLAKIATATKPSGGGVFLDSSGRSQVADNILMAFYGAGIDGATFDARVIGWRAMGTLWIPSPLVEVAVILSTAVGVAGQPVLNTERFADTLSLSDANTNVDASVVSPADNTLAHLMFDTKGFAILELIFDLGTATSANALWAVL